MKIFIMMIVGLVAGYLIGVYTAFRFTVDFSADNVSKIIVDSAQNIYTGTNLGNSVNSAVNKTTQDFRNQIEQKKEEIKENIKQQLIDYLKDRVNSLF